MNQAVNFLQWLNPSFSVHPQVLYSAMHGSYWDHSKVSQLENFYKQLETEPGQADIGGTNYIHLNSLFRWAKNVIVPYMLIGGSLSLGYQLVYQFFAVMQNHNNDRPIYLNPMLATTVVSTLAAGLKGASPKFWFLGAFGGSMIFAPISWWMYMHARYNGGQVRNSNVFY